MTNPASPTPDMPSGELQKRILYIIHQYKYGKTALSAGMTMRSTEGFAEVGTIMQLIEDTCMEVIGNDEIHMIHVKGGSTYDGYIEPTSFNDPSLVTRNKLRTEQRATLARKLGKTEENV